MFSYSQSQMRRKIKGHEKEKHVEEKQALQTARLIEEEAAQEGKVNTKHTYSLV